MREVPAHDGFEPAVSAIETDGVTGPVIEIVMAFEVAGLPVTPTRLDVITHVTI